MGSVALLADTIHNFGDAVTAVPLFVAFRLGRREANNRYAAEQPTLQETQPDRKEAY